MLEKTFGCPAPFLYVETFLTKTAHRRGGDTIQKNKKNSQIMRKLCMPVTFFFRKLKACSFLFPSNFPSIFTFFKKKTFIVAQCAEIRNESAFLAFTCFMYDMM